MNKAQQLRHIILPESRPNTDLDEIMRKMRTARLKAKSELFALNNQDISRDIIQGIRLNIFFPSLVLVSLGIEDAIEDVLVMYKYMPGPIQSLGNYAALIVPLPDMYRDMPANLEWLWQNKERLTWDPEHERFVLSECYNLSQNSK